MIGATIGEIFKVLLKTRRLLGLLLLIAPVSFAAAPMPFFRSFSTPVPGNSGGGVSPIAPAPAATQGYAYNGSGMTAKARPESREILRVLLANSAAEPYEAGGTLRRLRFIGVDFETSGASDRMDSPADRKARDIAMSLALPRDLGLVIIAAEPIAWKVTYGGVKERARIGFEGAAPFAIDAPTGLMSAFRIGALGARRPAYPLEPAGETKGNLARFCTTLSRWAHHFSVTEWDRIEYVRLSNPGAVAINEDVRVTVAGRVASRYSGSTLRTLCFGPQRSTYSSGTSQTTGRIWNPVTRRYN